MHLRSRSASFAFAALAVGALSACATGCADDGNDEELGAHEGALTDGEGGERLVYFHGMSRLGFSRDALDGVRGDRGLLAPSLTDAQIQAAPSATVKSFIAGADHATVAGYSLGRIPVLKLMQQAAPGMQRVVLVDPTYDSASGIGKSIGGGIGRAWLDGAEDRTLLLVYGDVTKSLGGETSYVDELAQHPRAELCYIAGDHERFRKADMAQALVASSCADLRSRLGVTTASAGDAPVEDAPTEEASAEGASAEGASSDDGTPTTMPASFPAVP